MMLALGKSASALLRFLRRYRAGLIISTICCVLSLGLYIQIYIASRRNPVLQFLRSMELKTLDMRFELRGPREVTSPVVIVAIDQKSEDVLGRWPFPRSEFARALDFLRAAGARAVAFDVNFPQPDQNSALQALTQLKAQYDEPGKKANGGPFQAHLESLIMQADNDKQFAQALSQYPNAILGYFFLPQSEAPTRKQDLQRVTDFDNYLSFQTYPQVSYYPANPRWSGAEMMKQCISLFQSNGGPEFFYLSPNLPAFANYAKNFGYFNIFPDADGTVRREPVVALYDGNFYPSLDVAAAMAFLNVPLDKVSAVFNPNGLQDIDLGGRLTIPTDPAGFVQIDYHGPAGTYPQYSLSDVVLHKKPEDLFRGKLVLIGPTATGIGDTAVTPFVQMEKAFPGVEVHANFIDDILSDHFIRRGNWELDVFFLVLFSLGAGILLTVAPPLRATSVMVVILGIFLWLAYYLFAIHRVWILVFLPVATLTTNYAGIISYRFFFEEREKKKVRGAFQQYLPPSLINMLLARPELLRLGGEEKELSIMFTDIRGFTSLSEGLSPRELVDLLNEYLSEMTAVIFKHWGTLDKYIGDAIMAFWGSPYPQPDHAERACATALHMLKSLEKLRQNWAAKGRPLIDIGVGVNSGPVLVGNMGSSVRFNFTIMGDNVNLASRLEGLNKQFATRVIISENTYQKVFEKFVVRELDLIRVKGKKVPVKIYELIAPVEEAEAYHNLVSHFHRALTDYRDGRWEAAIEILEGLLRDYPQDGPSKVLLGRCQDFLAHPPEGSWDGVYVMKTK
jgi:adenylate cyclase